MATNFPTAIDTLTNPTATDKVSVVNHADQHANANDAIEALETKVGVDGSAVTTTHDYKLSNVTDGDKAVSDVTYQANKTIIETDIVNLETSDTQNVKITGNQTIAGVKTFTESPIVPTPTTDFQTSTKKYVDDALTGINKSSVGLYTQGDFIDQFIMDLEILKQQQSTNTTLTGAINLPSWDTSNGVDFISSDGNGSDCFFFDYSLSGSVFTQTQNLTTSSLNYDYSGVVSLSTTKAVAVYSDNSGAIVQYLEKSGSTWSVSNTLTLSGFGGVRFTLFAHSPTEIYIAALNTNVRIRKFIISSGTIVQDGGFSQVLISNGTENTVDFNSSTELFLRFNNTSIQKYSFASGTSTTIGSVGTLAFNAGIRVIGDDVIVLVGGTIHTYEFDGTNYSITSISSSSGIDPNRMAIVSPTLFIDFNNKVELIGSGTENAIVDTSGSGHLRYMSSTTSNGSGGQTLILSGTVSNDGELLTIDAVTGSDNKVLLSVAPTTAETVTGVVITTKIGATSDTWMPKGSNYYLGNN
jgi:hypothetical protein